MMLRHGPIALNGHEDVRRFEIPVDDAFLMRVLHAFAELDEQLETLTYGQTVAVTIRRDRFASHVLHREVRTAFGRAAAVEHFGNRGVFHQRQGLAFGLEARDDLSRVHPGLDDLHRHLTAHRMELLGEPHLAHAAFAQALQQSIRPDELRRCRGRCGQTCHVGIWGGAESWVDRSS